MKRTITLSLLLLLSFTAMAQKKSTVNHDGTTVNFTVKKRSAFVKSTGSADGPELVQRFGNLEEVIKAIGIDLHTDIAPQVNRLNYEIEARGPKAKNLSSIQNKLLDQMAETASFEWRIERQKRNMWTVVVEDEAKLLKHQNRKPGVVSYSYTSGRKFEMINTLETIVEEIHNSYLRPKGLVKPNLNYDQAFSIKLSTKSQKQILEQLREKYGILLQEKLSEVDVLIIE